MELSFLIVADEWRLVSFPRGFHLLDEVLVERLLTYHDSHVDGVVNGHRFEVFHVALLIVISDNVL